jgi:hypothetical protein
MMVINLSVYSKRLGTWAQKDHEHFLSGNWLLNKSNLY